MLCSIEGLGEAVARPDAPTHVRDTLTVEQIMRGELFQGAVDESERSLDGVHIGIMKGNLVAATGKADGPRSADKSASDDRGFHASAMLGRHVSVSGDERRVGFLVHGFSDFPRRSRMLGELRFRTYRPSVQAAATVGADVLQKCIDTGLAECALEAADHGFGRVRR